jgi:hypothetical protein
MIVGIAVTILTILLVLSPNIFSYASAFVNIVSPPKGEAVPAGSPLTVSGTSDDNAQINCNIQIIVNGQRPYQETIPVAPGDYSEWTFVVNPQYAEIEEGINTLTSKAICDSPHEPFLVLDPLTVKHYSINVTGVPSGVEGGGIDSEEPFAFPAPGDDLGDGAGGTEEEQDEDEESTSGESVFD